MGILSLVVLICSAKLSLESTPGKVLPNFAGPYRILVRRVNNESDEFTSTGQVWSRLYVTQAKPKELQYRWGQSFVEMELDDSYRIVVRMAAWSSNGWKNNAFVMNLDKACSSVMKISRSWAIFITGVKDIKCPIPKGLYQVKNESFHLSAEPMVRVFPYGRWRFSAVLINKESQGVGIFNLLCETVPKL